MVHPSRTIQNMLVGSAKALDKVAELDETKKEALNPDRQDYNTRYREPNDSGTSSGSSAKGTGLKALEFALSICDSVDMYGIIVDPVYEEWLDKVLFRVQKGTHSTTRESISSNDGMSWSLILQVLSALEIVVTPPPKCSSAPSSAAAPPPPPGPAVRVGARRPPTQILLRQGQGRGKPAASTTNRGKVRGKDPRGVASDDGAAADFSYSTAGGVGEFGLPTDPLPPGPDLRSRARRRARWPPGARSAPSPTPSCRSPTATLMPTSITVLHIIPQFYQVWTLVIISQFPEHAIEITLDEWKAMLPEGLPAGMMKEFQETRRCAVMVRESFLDLRDNF
ncbi:hypothetical protein ABZP36_001459 [Zizania latifolia]